MRKIKLYNLEGFTRRSGNTETDGSGSSWTTFDYTPHDNPPFADCNECPGCGADWSDLDMINECPGCGKNADDLELLLADTCDVCGKPCLDGWICLDGGEVAHDGCVITVESLRDVLKTNNGIAEDRYTGTVVSAIVGGYRVTWRKRGAFRDMPEHTENYKSLAGVSRALHANWSSTDCGWGK